MSFPPGLAGGIDFQQMLQRMLAEESTKSKVNLYDAFKIHFIEEKAQLMNLLQTRSKVFEDEFFTYLPSETPNLESAETPAVNGKSAENSKKKNLNVIKMKLSEVISKSEDQVHSPPKAYLVKCLHQFLGEKERLLGYSNAKFDILINRYTFQWTLFGFYHEKASDAEDMSLIMHSFRELNSNEDPLPLTAFVNSLKGEVVKAKQTGILNEFKANGWDISTFQKIEKKPEWDYSKGCIKQAPKLMAKPVGNFKSSLFQTPSSTPKHNTPRVKQDLNNTISLYDIRNLFLNEKMIQRIETLMKLYIETVSNINIDDQGWNLILAFNSRGQLVGFTSYFKFGINVNNLKIRVSQVFVMPDYQRKGVASQMLSGLYSLFWEKNSSPILNTPEYLESLISKEFQGNPEIELGVEGIGIESPSPVFIIVMIRFLLQNLPKEIYLKSEEEVKTFLNKEGIY